MSPVSVADGHDAPGPVTQSVPGLAAQGDDLVVEFEELLDSQLSRMNCQRFSVGFNSGARGGSGRIVMLSSRLSLPVVCHPT